MKKTNKTSNTPSIFTIFGATGDLAAKKIIPSLWHLFGQGRLPTKLSIIGFSRRDINNDEFHSFIYESVINHGGEGVKKESLYDFFQLFSYQKGSFEDEKAFRSLSDRIEETERLWGVCANKLFYLAVPPSSFGTIFKNLAEIKLNLPCGGDIGWSRVLIEKPFGLNLNSSRELQMLISTYFKEEQIYRIDHYLFKEIVQGIKNFRFSNNLFENIWDNTTIDRIDIRLLESVGVEERGNFYDPIGTLRDVGQNHILTILATLAMEYPREGEADSTQKSRADILKTLKPWTNETVQKNSYRAQYSGYKKIKGVNEASETETYFALKTELIRPRWKGIPVFIEAGKRMTESRKEIVLTLKHPSVCLLCEVGPHAPNRIVFRLEPKDEIVIHFWTKKPGFEQTLEERTFSFFVYEEKIKVQYVEEYSKILHAVIEGDRTQFISSEEVEASWKFIDPIIDVWKQNLVPLAEYKPDETPKPSIFLNDANDQNKKIKSHADEIGIVGLGKMGANLARRLRSKKWKVVGFNETPDVTKELELEEIEGAYSLRELVDKLSKPRTIWLMVPHQVVNKVLDELLLLLDKGDTVMDGGNSPYKKSILRNKHLREKGINFLDVGVSGGPGGARNGACLMIGGEKKLYEEYENLFKDLSVEGGYGYMGNSGAGHFVKMVHNGIEYGMMQAIGEGFEIIKKSPFSLDPTSISEVYNHGSVITSRLVGWLAEAYKKFGNELNAEECCSGEVSHSGEGQWTVDAARELNIPVAIIDGALEFRKKSQGNPSYTGRVVSALRHQFGGHNVSNKEK